MPTPKNNEEFFKQWNDFMIEDAKFKTKMEVKQEQTKEDIEELKGESEKNKKVRYAVGGLSILAAISGVWTSIKWMLGVH